MFAITGHINGRTYEEELISARDLIDLFNLPIDFNSKSGQMTFELHETQKSPDRLNGGFRHQSGKMLRSLIEGNHDGSSINIQYYTRKTRKRVNGDNIIQYVPHHIDYNGDKVTFSLDTKNHPEDLEQLVFLLLCPKCQDSPLSPVHGSKRYYQIDNAVQKATNKVSQRNRLFMMFSAIMGEDADIHFLRTKAAGMNIHEHLLEDVQVQDALMSKAEQNPSEFWKLFDNPNTSFHGIIQRALNSGVIVKKHLGGSMFAYGFNAEISNRDFSTPFQELVQFPMSANGVTELKKALKETPRLIDSINNYLLEKSVEAEVSEVLSDEMFTSKAGRPKKTKAAPKAKKEASAKEDPFESAAKWLNENDKLVLDGTKISYKVDDQTSHFLGEIEVEEPIVPQVAFLLSENRKVMKAVAAAMQ